jgi:short-subunit dehydrogenase
MTMASPLDRSNPVIVITGASSGIGAATALMLAKQTGIRLVLAARRQVELEAIAASCRASGATVLTVPTDLADPDQAVALGKTALQAFGRVDAVVNNAGYGQMGPVELLPMAQCQRQFAVNVFGPIALIQTLIPAMREQGGGRIINISSIAGRVAFPMAGLYSASKFALESLSDSLRMELKPFDIDVCVVEPGPVATEFVTAAADALETTIVDPEKTPYRAAFAHLEQLNNTMQRQFWSAEQVAQVVVRALSDRQPRPRYVAATGGRTLLFLMRRVLPTWVVDQFWQRFYGIHRVAQEWHTVRQNPSSTDKG